MDETGDRRGSQRQEICITAIGYFACRDVFLRLQRSTLNKCAYHKNSSDKLLASYPHQNEGMGFEANAPLKGFLNQGATGETLLIYFSVFDAEQKALNRTILLGKLKLQ